MHHLPSRSDVRVQHWRRILNLGIGGVCRQVIGSVRFRSLQDVEDGPWTLFARQRHVVDWRSRAKPGQGGGAGMGSSLAAEADKRAGGPVELLKTFRGIDVVGSKTEGVTREMLS